MLNMSIQNFNGMDDLEMESLIQSHRQPLLGFLITLTACKSTAEDLVQETCIILWEKRADITLIL